MTNTEKTVIDRFNSATDVETVDSIKERISENQVQSIARKVINIPDPLIKSWDVKALKNGVGGGSIFRVFGDYRAEKSNGWSVILKVLYRHNSTQGLTEFDWNREANVYRSGIIDNIPGGFEAAECFYIDDISDNEIWIWMEDLGGSEEQGWPLERYALAAQHLGQMNGHFFLQNTPYQSWMVRAFEKQAIRRDLDITKYHQYCDNKLVQQMIPPPRRKILLEIYEKHLTIITSLFEKMPQSFGHMDAFRGNIFSKTKTDGKTKTTAIDWAFAGINPLGTDLKVLVYHSIGFMFVDNKNARQLDELAFHAYLEGLNDVGWEGSSYEVRYGYLMISMMTLLRFSCLIPPLVADEEKHSTLERIFNRPFTEIHEKNIGLWDFLLELGEEALELDKRMLQN